MSARRRADRPRVDPTMRTLHVLRRGLRASPALRTGIVGTLVLAVVGSAGRVAVPVLVQQVLDRGLRGSHVRLHLVWTLCGIGAVVVVAAATCMRAARRRLTVAAQQGLYQLRTDAFAHIHRLSLADHTDEHRGALVSRVTSDVETLSVFFEWGGVAWLVSGITMAVTAVVMAIYDWRLTLVVAVLAVPIPFALGALQARLTAAYTVVRDRIGELLSTISETVMGAATIRAFGARDRAERRTDRAIRAAADAEIRAARYSAVLFPSAEIFIAVTVAAVIGVGILIGPTHGISAGRLVAFVFLVTLFLEPVSDMTEIIDVTQTAVAGWRKVLDVLDTPIEVLEPDDGGVELPPGPPEVVLDRVTFAYRNGPPVLRDVSLHIAPESRVAVVGATGSGKTTLAKLVTRLADPTSGRVLVGDLDLREVSFTSLRRTVVMVPQDGFLFDTTVGENVRIGRLGASDGEVAGAFADLALDDWLESLPRGLDTPVGGRGEQLSVGERQLVALARAYLARPACLILDEATSAVDPATDVRLTHAIERLAEGRTVITIAHRLATAERADVVIVMDDGRIVEEGSHAALLAADGFYAHLYRSWLEGTGDAGAGAGSGRYEAMS